MDFIFDVRAKDAFKVARAAGKTARFAGNMCHRILSTSFNGVCQTCNNLQPLNHERTFGRPEVPWEQHPWENRDELIKIPTLALQDIKAKDILASRQVDQKTGKPKNDCAHCRLLCEVFDHFFGFETDRWDHHVMSGMEFNVGIMIKQGQPIIINCYGFEWDPTVSTSRVDLEMYTEFRFPPGATDAPCISGSGVRASDSSSPECMAFIKDCVQQCYQEHPRCRIDTPSEADFTPTRLIYIGQNDDDIRLCETASTGLHFTWAALSHCWGGGKPFSLTTENINEVMADIPFNHLPNTFKDAIQICRILSIEYLWIDSLCIIQNSKQDWNREAAQMGLVYSHALVVISGSSSKNPDTPFLGPRDEDWLPRQFDFQTSSTGTKLSIMVRRRHMLAAPLEQGLHDPPYTESWGHRKHKGPIYKRAWCFQEAHLATRIIHFSPGAIIFECRTHRRSEDQLPPYPQMYSNILGQVSEDSKWRQVVQQYTSRQLTFASDKLPAISGIASLTPRAHRATYLAGLWQDSILYDLLWQVNPNPKEILTYPPSQDGSGTPSWSWASINRAVVYNPMREFKPLAKLVNFETIPTTPANVFGSVKSASLTLQARIRSCRIFFRADKYSHRAYYLSPEGEKNEEKHFVSDGLLTTSYPEAPMGSRYARRAREGDACGMVKGEEMDAAFLCLADTGFGHYNHVGLLVTPSKDVEGAWERVGILTNVRRKWWEGGEEVEVTLV